MDLEPHIHLIQPNHFSWWPSLLHLMVQILEI